MTGEAGSRAPRLRGSVEGLQLYPRALRVAEAVASFRAGVGEAQAGR